MSNLFAYQGPCDHAAGIHMYNVFHRMRLNTFNRKNVSDTQRHIVLYIVFFHVITMQYNIMAREPTPPYSKEYMTYGI